MKIERLELVGLFGNFFIIVCGFWIFVEIIFVLIEDLFKWVDGCCFVVSFG